VPFVLGDSFVVEGSTGHVSGCLEQNFGTTRRHLKLEIVNGCQWERELGFDLLYEKMEGKWLERKLEDNRKTTYLFQFDKAFLHALVERISERVTFD